MSRGANRGPERQAGHASARASGRGRRVLAIVFWWIVTLAILVVLDDLTFGPIFWTISRLIGPGFAAAAAFSIYAGVQVFIVHQGTSKAPNSIATFFLNRLDLQRRSPVVADNERRLRGRVMGGGSALVLSPLIGGVIPPMILWRNGFDRNFVRSISYLTASIYAAEFAFLHGWIPGTTWV